MKNKISIVLLFIFIANYSLLRAQNTITVYPDEYSKILSNPLKGFRPDPGNRIGDPNYPTTIVRDYITWSSIEKDSTDGVQKIIDFCNARWKDYEKKNVKVIPRVYILWDANGMPGNWPSDLTPGDWTSQKFKDRVVKLIYKLGIAWDNDPRVAWVQTGIMGWWGEQENPVGINAEYAKLLGDAFSKAFKNKKFIVRNQASWETAGYKLGTYWDSYAHPSQANVRNDIMLRNNQGRYLNQIIEGETAYNWGFDTWNPKYGDSPNATLNNYKFTNNMIDAIRELHCTGLGWIASYTVDGAGGTNIDTVKANATRIQNAFGYHFAIPEFSTSSRVDQGGDLAIHFKVKNVGSAPFYENWQLAFVLIDEITKQIVWKEPIPNVDIRNWLPGDKYSLTTKKYQTLAKEYTIDATFKVPSTITTGQYMAGITILEPYSQSPGVFFAVKNFLAKSQTQPLCRIGIGQDLVGDYEVNPALFGDPEANDARYYSLTPQGFGYNLSTNVTNGSVALYPAGGKYLRGTVVTVIVKSNFGYKFNSWSGDLSGSDKQTTITMDGDKSISVNFDVVPTYQLATNATNGSIEIKPTGSTFEEGANVTINAIPEFGYQFSGWSGDVSGTENPISIVMNANKSITATFTKLEGTIVFATNCGGKAFTASDGIAFTADANFTTGSTYSTTAAIGGTTDDALYQSERYGTDFSYNIPLSNGSYQVMLQFAENYFTSANSRVFNVAIEGTKVITNLDIWSEAGAKTAYNTIHFVTVTDGELNITFTGVVNNAKISAIKIFQVSNPTGIYSDLNNLPQQTIIYQVTPNPFSTETKIRYQLSEATPVMLSVYNLLGKKITSLVNEYQSAGNYSVDWNVADYKGTQLDNGMYLFKLETGTNPVQTIKAVLIR